LLFRFFTPLLLLLRCRLRRSTPSQLLPHSASAITPFCLRYAVTGRHTRGIPSTSNTETDDRHHHAAAAATPLSLPPHYGWLPPAPLRRQLPYFSCAVFSLMLLARFAKALSLAAS